MPNSIFVIIVTYNGMQWIDTCLKSCVDYPVIVVDNFSTDETVSFIETNYSNVILLKQAKNLGFGQANNIGINYALIQGADYVFLLNQDAYLKPDTLNTLMRVARTTTKYGILSPMHFNGVETNLDSNFLKFIERSNTHALMLKDYALKTLKTVYLTTFVNAAGWLLSREVLLTVGGFDPIFFHYGEDRNYCQRVLYHGFDIGVVPEAIILHDREDRKKEVTPVFSENYYKEFEKYAKIELADINENEVKLMIAYKFDKLNSQFIKNILKLNFKKVKDIKVKCNIIKMVKKEVVTSRELNKRKQPNYLNL